MKLSLIIPAYNAERTLETCLDSVLNQNGIDSSEVIVINDGSKDGTAEILEKYAQRYPSLLKYCTVENGGQGTARNIGIGMAHGEWIGFVDSDDWIETDMFAKMINCAEKEQADLVLCDVMAHFPDGRTEPERIWRENCPIAAAGFANNKVFRKTLLNGIRFAEERLWYEDLEFTAKAVHRAVKMVHLEEYLYHYRRGLPSTMNNNNAKKNLDILTVMGHLEEEFLPDDRADFEFLVLNHILIDAMNRVQAMDAPDKKDVLWLMRSYVHEKIPNLSASESFRRESRNRRIIMRLHANGFSWLAGTLLGVRG